MYFAITSSHVPVVHAKYLSPTIGGPRTHVVATGYPVASGATSCLMPCILGSATGAVERSASDEHDQAGNVRRLLNFAAAAAADDGLRDLRVLFMVGSAARRNDERRHVDVTLHATELLLRLDDGECDPAADHRSVRQRFTLRVMRRIISSCSRSVRRREEASLGGRPSLSTVSAARPRQGSFER